MKETFVELFLSRDFYFNKANVPNLGNLTDFPVNSYSLIIEADEGKILKADQIVYS